MGSAALLQPLLSVAAASLCFPRPRPLASSAHFSCSVSSRRSISVSSQLGIWLELARSGRERASLLIANSSSEEEEAGAAAGEAEVDEVSTAAEEEGEEDAPEDSDAGLAVDKPPRKPITKLGDVMGILHKRAIEASEKERPVPDIRTGDIVEIKLEVPENRRRASIYKGIVISKQNAGIHTTIRIRRIIAGTGVEIVFPVYSPNIKEIKVVNHRKVRRARLYYLRDKLPRFSTFK